MVIQGFGRADLDTASIGTVHAGASIEQPGYFPTSFYLSELHFKPGLRGEVGWIFVAAPVN
jgi:hypothetical protein